PTVYRQADRAGDELRCAGCYRDRKYSAAQRAARVVTAADRDRRRAQGDQPVDLRSPNSPRYAGGVGRKTVRGRYCGDASSTGLELSGGCDLRRPSDYRELILRRIPFEAGRGSVLGRTVLERQ